MYYYLIVLFFLKIRMYCLLYLLFCKMQCHGSKRFYLQTQTNKKVFLALPPNVYLVSNCYKRVGPNTSTPVFYEYVEPLEKRKTQWERIKAAGADQRLCDVYRSSEAFKKDVEYKTARYENYPQIVVCEVDKKEIS